MLMETRKQPAEGALARREIILYLLAGLGILAALAVLTSLSPGLLDQLVKSLKSALQMYVGF
jgi:hypothetical protein